MKYLKTTFAISAITLTSVTMSYAVDNTIENDENDEYINSRYYDNAFSNIVNSNINDPQLIQIRNESQKKIKDYFYKRDRILLYTFDSSNILYEYMNSSYYNDISDILFKLYKKISTISPENLKDLKQFYSNKVEELNKKVKERQDSEYIEDDISQTFQVDAKQVIKICEYIKNELENYDDYFESL